MPLKTTELALTEDSGGRTLRFRMTQMPASRAEDLVCRLAHLLVRSGADLEGAPGNPASPFAIVGYLCTARGVAALSGIDYDDLRPILDAMWEGVEIAGDDGGWTPLTPDLVDSRIAEVTTLFRLRREVLALNFGFFGDAVRWISRRSPAWSRA
ncbi:hypothetical protein IHV25_07235 [Phaeovibrio sulfidiphilus]|uniref:Uncharacterized protein n=1 Tax=Phaeovibrio sulfidiphilus TaxID=1220600 RepID=A0A8J7CR48_9PROT|nr:hypothetical protein [Phaeovibrio sulfidiphilus]MBE1237440.1 hypothetical protein [Phaeovibrio sulfidiphilus]